MQTKMLAIVLVATACSSSHPGSTTDAPHATIDATSDAPGSGGTGDRATGQLGAWQTAAPLPVARANHCSVTIDNWVLAIGGNRSDGSGGFVNTDEIDAAQVAADGTLGAWQVAGHLPSPGSQSTCTTDGNTLYVIDGIFDDSTVGGQVWASTWSATGQLTAFSSLGALPAGDSAISEAATVLDGTLLITTSNTPGSGSDPGNDTFTLATPIGGSAALTWSSTTWQGLDFIAQAELGFSGTAAYVIGGYDDPSIGAVANAYMAPIGHGATLGTAATTTALPMPVAFGRAAIVDSWVFVVGGRAQVYAADANTTVYAAPIADTGALGTWTTPTALSMPRTNHALALVGDFLVLTGGGSGGPGDTTVLVSRARTPATTD